MQGAQGDDKGCHDSLRAPATDDVEVLVTRT